jgi:hypothetical protein
MIWLRKGVVHLLGILLFISLLGGVWALDINHNFSQPDKLKTWLHDSKIYDKALSATLKDAQNEQNETGGDTSVSLTDPNIQNLAGQAFTPQLVEKSVNTFIDANYAWLQGKTDKPAFSIDLSGAKADFATRAGQFVQQRLTSLPACTPAEQAQLQIPVDAFSVTCRPSGLDPTAEGNRVRDEINNSQDFLGQPNVNADNVNKQDQAEANQEPYYQKLASLPKVYRIGQKLPYIFVFLALLSALGIVFISLTRRKGWRRVGVILAIAGLILVIIKFAADSIANTLTDKSLNSGVAAQLKQPRDDLIKTIEQALVKFDLLFGIIFIVLAVIIFVMLRRTSEDRPKPTAPTPQGPSILDEDPAPSSPETPVRTVDELPRFKQPQPRPKRPPRLIQ